MFGLIAQNAWLYGGAFILVLSVLVFVHEWGHYYVARRCGVRIETFSIGFGPELFGVNDKHGTRWKFSLVPLGGYVKMFGDTDPASAGHVKEAEEGETKREGRPLTADERKVAFYTQPVGKRAAIVFAGPAINFIFAIIVLAILFMTLGQPVTPPVAAAVVHESAAAEAGFQPHDEIVAIDGRKVRRFEDIRREVMVGLDTPRTFTVKRDDVIMEIIAAPRKKSEEDHFGFVHSRGFLGLISAGHAVKLESIAAINGKPVKDVAATRNFLKANMDKTFTIDVKRSETETDVLTVRPVRAFNEDMFKEGSNGYDLLYAGNIEGEIVIKHKPLEALFEAIHETGSITVSTLQALGQMVSGTRSATELGGIIRIGAMAGDMAKSGFIALVTFTALLSINLGLINLFPIPLLDGGHLTFYAIEAARGVPVSENVQEYAFRLGLALLVGIMLFANINDIMQLIL
jgi:regulator of sigma E protease